MGFALFFLAEYSSMILMSSLTTVLFLGGWVSFFSTFQFLFDQVFFSLKTCLVLFFFIWVRASFPRYRIDQLMRLCWKIFLPISLAFIFIVLSIIFSFNGIY
jgi:NADH-quinone oxidoreductase subunit H